jgi:regulator of protease activity HflC (stomatin/prohibitin superfamily)
VPLPLIFAIVFAVLAAVAFLVRARFASARTASGGIPRDVRMGATGIGWAALALAAFLLFWASFTIVPPKNVGFLTAFGKPVGVVNNGWAWHAPWVEVTKWDGKYQNELFSDTSNADDGPGVTVRLANQSQATVDVQFQWAIRADKANTAQLEQMFRNYQDERAVKRNLVQKELVRALNRAFGTYDPVTALVLGQTQKQSLDALGKQALQEMQDTVGTQGVDVISVVVQVIHFDQQTEERIRNYNAAVADTRIAIQQEKTAEAKRAANDILSGGNTGPGVLYQNCLDMTERLEKAGVSLPNGWTCGNPNQVVVPATK